jgi:hypothetical protein
VLRARVKEHGQMAHPAPSRLVLLDSTVLSRLVVRDLLVGLPPWLLSPVWTLEQLRRAEGQLGARFRFAGLGSRQAKEALDAFGLLFPGQLVTVSPPAAAAAARATALPRDAGRAEAVTAAIVTGAPTILTFRLPARRSRTFPLVGGGSVEYEHVDSERFPTPIG